MTDSNPGDRIARLTPEERSALGSRLMKKRPHAASGTIPRLDRAQSPLPLSFAQQRMWFMEQLTPGIALYNVPWAVRLTGPLDVGALRRSLKSLVERHRILRTTYQATEGVPYQVVSESASLPFHVIDLRGSSIANGEEELHQVLREEAICPFDLSSDCMLRATVAELTNLEHVLLLVAHHIAVDGWSCKILNHELGVLYEAILDGKEPVLPDLPIEYTDYVAWQRDEARNSELDQELAYWRTKLEGLSPTLDLPTSSSQPTGEAFSGGKVPIMISNETATRVHEIARKLNITPFMILASAVMITLYRYTGETDIAIGTPIEGRTRLETESLVGLFVNTLVLRGDLSGRPSFAEALQRIKSVCVEAYDHQGTPFEQIVAALAPKRNEDRSPIVQIMLAYWNFPSEIMSFAGMSATPIDVGTDTSKFDISFSLSETAEGIVGHLVYSRRFFSEARMRSMAAHFVRLLETGIDESEQAIGRMPMLSASERETMVVNWNAATAPEPEAGTVHGLFERAAAATPEATAVVCGDDSLTYGDLNERANRLAYYLRGLGVRADELVGISMHRSTDLIVGLLGILKAGAAYLPLDYRFPPNRLRFMMEDAAVRVFLTQSDLEANQPTEGLQVVCLDSDWPEIAQIEPVPGTGTKPEDLAYVIYTSGSTGQPKGVMVSHQNVVGFLYSYREVISLKARRVSTNVITYSFDTSIDEIFSTICFGGTLHVVPYEITLDGSRLANYLIDHHINVTYIVPEILPDVAATFEARKAVGDLLCLDTGLAPKKESLLQRFRDLSPTLRIINSYGPTEVTYGATAHIFDVASDPDADVPIGKPFPNYQIYIVNEMLEPVPIGVTGEILIGGVGVSRGYLNRPDLTEERFIPNPFRPDLSPRLYRAGDLGRYREDGTIEFLGRTDSQVKIRGYRIELREIELAVESHPLVKSCHTGTSTLTEDDVRLVTYVVCTGNQRCDAPVLRQYLLKKLPKYMIPSAFVFLDNLPLLPTGKIDQRALPEPEWGHSGSADRTVPPASETENHLAAIWKDVLKIDRVGITDNFFELGGHSLLAVQLIAQIEKAFSVSLPLSVLFDYPTIAGLSQAVQQQNPHLSRSTVVCIQKGDEGPPFFCIPPAASSVNNFAQLVHALSSDIPFYGIQALGLEPGEVPQDRIEDMAARYISDMKVVQPEGPYFIGGRCGGGHIAYEMALQLSDEGEKVALLALLDAALPPGLHRGLRYRVGRASYFHQRRQLTRAILLRVRSTVRQAWRSRVLRYLGSRRTRRILSTYKAHMHAWKTYAPVTYSGTITFFAPRDDYSPGGPRPLWESLTSGKFELHLVDGPHRTMLQDPVPQTLVRELEDVIHAARERTHMTSSKMDHQP